MSTHGNDYINRHRKYIDYRIAILSDYVTLNEGKKLTSVSDIISYLISDFTHNSADNADEFYSSLNELKYLISNWDILQYGDIIGYIYQMLQSRSNKKYKGQFFTPGDIVDYLALKVINKNDIDNNFRALDPSCGSGQFLLSVFKHLLEIAKNKNKDLKSAARKIALNNIFGADIDPVAVKIAKFNIAKLSGCKPDEINIYNMNFLIRDDLNLENIELNNYRFDLIIGNPPWGSRLSNKEKSYFRKKYQSSISGINTFTLFIERSFDYLKSEGSIAFLIPEAYLNIKAHRSSREFVLDNFIINELAVWGEKFKGVFAPSISFIMKEESSAEIRNKNIVRIRNTSNLKTSTTTLVPQASYHRTHENIYNINYSRKAVEIISLIDHQNCMYLKGRSKFFLGIVTGNNAKFISNKKINKYPDPIIIGKDVSQYKINFSNHYFKYDPEELQQVAPGYLYTTKNKILYKFIGKKLTFTLDRDGLFSLNNVNGIIPEFSANNIETTLSILNSGIIQYYYSKNFFTVKVLRGNLERLPLKIISKENQKKLKSLTERIMNSDKEKFFVYKENIEDIIFYEYGIKDKEAYMISNAV